MAQPAFLVQVINPSGNPGEVPLVQLLGSSAAESKTESNAVADVVTFSAPITAVEVYHSEATPQVFVINGISLTIPSGGWRSSVAGVPAATVTLPSGITGVIVTRLV